MNAIVSRRQNRGLLVISLLFLAESVSLTNAVTFWTASATKPQGQKRTTKSSEEGGTFATRQQECQADSAGTCSENQQLHDQPTPVKLAYPRARLTANKRSNLKSPEECCRECTSCMNEAKVAELCAIPRGGHGIHHHASGDVVAEKIVEHHAHVLPYGIPLNGWKVIFQAFLTALNVLCWLIPLRSKKISENKLALSLANAFSGGVFLSLAFGHLIPECIHGFEGYNEVTPFMIVLGGYLLIFFVEKVAFDTHDLLHDMEGDDDGHAHHGSNGHAEASALSSGRSAVILLAALGIHSILEMMALGLADSFGDCALLTLSISLHQVSFRGGQKDSGRY
jgi:zinc transporter 1/2/3